MVSKKSRTAVRENKHRRMRHHLAGTAHLRSEYRFSSLQRGIRNVRYVSVYEKNPGKT